MIDMIKGLMRQAIEYFLVEADRDTIFDLAVAFGRHDSQPEHDDESLEMTLFIEDALMTVEGDCVPWIIISEEIVRRAGAVDWSSIEKDDFVDEEEVIDLGCWPIDLRQELEFAMMALFNIRTKDDLAYKVAEEALVSYDTQLERHAAGIMAAARCTNIVENTMTYYGSANPLPGWLHTLLEKSGDVSFAELIARHPSNSDLVQEN